MKILFEKLSTPGEHTLTLQGLVGTIEAILTVPEKASTFKNFHLAIIGHPHSLQGGTMHNKVVTTTARAFKDLAMPSLRFNFRGVGKTEGTYDDGVGESEDMCHLMRLCQKEKPDIHFLLAGFSFGSYVAYRSAAQIPSDLLITIAPPVHHFDYEAFPEPPKPWVIFQGDEDEIVPLTTVLDFSTHFTPPLPVVQFAKTSHFFHGKLLELRTQLTAIVSEQLSC
ncbi:MAG: hypothetical protein H2069_01180 [Legionella sp.]|nr:hypothetical protein [Legionella sp.]